MQHITHRLTWFTPKMGATSTKLCFYYITWGKLAQSVALHMQCEISSRPLAYFYLYISFLSIYPSLSSSLWMVITYRLKWLTDKLGVWIVTTQSVWLTPESTSKIIYWPTNDSSYEPTNWLTDWLANPLQYKMQAFISGPKVSPLQHCGPVPTVNPNPK